jgi:ribosomal protein S18 acetylase RimI-like enzyme
MVVAPGFRSSGLGAVLMTAIEAEARARRMKWIFLESGMNNRRAHHFFERNGFSQISCVFVKPLADV